MKYRVGVVGGSGYAGLELIKIIFRHPEMECVAIMAADVEGDKPLGEIHPQLRGMSEINCFEPDLDRFLSMQLDTAFLCTPNEASHELVPKILERGVRVIDFSGSFRLKDVTTYDSWYGFHHASPELVDRAVYGLPEWNALAIAKATLIANPGCYPTSILIPLLPLVRGGMVEPGSHIISDSKSGVTGAGRGARVETLFAEVSDNFRPYSPITHRHGPEVCQELGWSRDNFTFVPHLLPTNRGMMSTLYLSFQHPVSSEQIEAAYLRRYQKYPMVRILGNSRLPEIRAVNNTNFCDIGWRLTDGGRRGVFFCAIDNLIKGAAGQAVQNFNLMHDFEDSLGLMERCSVEVDC
jgi:N-acetyl-gamma-glutamyl-phosphate reductase